MDRYKILLTSTVQSVQATMLIGIGLVHLAVDLKGRVHDSVGVASGHTTQVVVLLVDAVVAGIVKAEDNVTNLAVMPSLEMAYLPFLSMPVPLPAISDWAKARRGRAARAAKRANIVAVL
jgi:hypothetical protein